MYLHVVWRGQWDNRPTSICSFAFRSFHFAGVKTWIWQNSVSSIDSNLFTPPPPLRTSARKVDNNRDGTSDEQEITHCLPPASQATAHGVDSWWNDNNNQEKTAMQDNNDNDEGGRTTMTRRAGQQRWWEQDNDDDNEGRTTMTTRAGQWWQWQWGQDNKEDPRTTTMTAPPTATMTNCLWSGNGVQWGWGWWEGTTAPLSLQMWAGGFFCSVLSDDRPLPCSKWERWPFLLCIYINYIIKRIFCVKTCE